MIKSGFLIASLSDLFCMFTDQSTIMKSKFYTLTLCTFLFSISTFASQKVWIGINHSEPIKCTPHFKALNSSESEIEINLPGFYLEEKQTPAGKAYSVSLPEAAKMLAAGNPDLSQLTFSLAIPDRAIMQSTVLSSSYTDYQYVVAPSKGNLKRNQDPSLVPFSYSAVYFKNEFYPSQLVSLRDPYILRDYRGQSVVVCPFQYNPVTQTLRVYHSIKIKVASTGNSSTQNILQRKKPISGVDATFAAVYKTHFLNAGTLTYTPLYEHGNMLVIADATLMSSMQPFVDWKNRMGQETEMIDVATIGANPSDIKTYIENYYTANGLTFVLLVGDGPMIPPFPSQYGDSDPSYGYILGGDSYAEVIVGRFSANDAVELETQVQRSLNYEMYPDPTGQWYHKGVCIGSDQGPGDDNEMDFEHERNIRSDFQAYTYTTVDELYDGSQGVVDSSGDPNASDLNASLNDGRGIVTYTGHGSSSSLGTTGYSISDVTMLTNFDELPFIWSVACVNGDFSSGTCLAEALMRSTSSTGKATGAVATLMSTINQSWDPPMDGQDEMVDILIETYPGNIKHTFGGISANGCMHMNDQYGADGDEITDTWTLFGDPSLMVRTNTPSQMAISHPANIDVNQTSFNVSCTENGALVCMSHNNQIISTGWSLMGNAALLPSGLTVGDTLDITVTAYNTIPYFGQVVVTSSTTGIPSSVAQSFSIFPNPASGIVSLNLPVHSENITIQVMNAIGKSILIVPQVSTEKLDLSHLAAGVYSVVVSINDKIIGVEKLVLEK